MINEHELLMMIKEGDDDLIPILINNNKRIINSILNKYQYRLKYNGISASETYSEIVKAIKRAIDYYDDRKDTSLKSYIRTIVENTIKGLIKNNNNILNNAIVEGHKYEDKGIFLEELAVDTISDPLLIIKDKETKKEIIELAKNELSKLEYQIFLYRIQGLKDKDICLILNMDKNRVYDTVYRVRKKLKKILEIPN